MTTPAPVVTVTPAIALHGPAHEYTSLLRSHLSEIQLAWIRDQVEAMVRDGAATTAAYIELLCSLLTPDQMAKVVIALEAVYLDRGWISPQPLFP